MILFHFIQYSSRNNGAILPNRHMLLISGLSGLTVIKHILHAHKITNGIHVKQILFKYL